MKTADPSFYAALAVAVALLVYLLSPPFVFAACGESFVDSHSQVLETIYEPAIWLNEHFPPYQFYISQSFKLVGVS